MFFMSYGMKIRNFHKVAGYRLQVAGVRLPFHGLASFAILSRGEDFIHEL